MNVIVCHFCQEPYGYQSNHYQVSANKNVSAHWLKRFVFSKAQSALIGQLTQDIVIGRTPQAACWALALKIKVKTVNNVLSFTISSCLRGEQSNVTDVMKLECVCKQAAIKMISDRLYTQLWCDPVSLSHTHTHDTHTWYVPGAEK